MSDLISRKVMIRMLKCNGFCSNTPEECVAEAIDFAKMITTVYDVDKVINQLKRKSFERYGNGGMGGELVVNLDDVLDIVKGGGLDE